MTRHGDEKTSTRGVRGSPRPRPRELVRYFAARSDRPPGGHAERSETATPSTASTEACANAFCLPAKRSAPCSVSSRSMKASSGRAPVKGRRGRGAYGKTVVFGIFERQGQVYTEIVPDCSRPTLQGHHPRPGGPQYRHQTPMAGVTTTAWSIDLGYGHFARRSFQGRVHQWHRPHQRH